ncbi:AMP-binding protein [Galbibacter sp.]|uniref:AMP-binding protein n=1 Tax=Galbibacter sp. TaxID=2918471 RepID=UPI002BE750D2|nr:AMP-binding protein [Galbibacter sp.]HLV62649.1 AMP-binding protein [Galbibacter sp.]
MGLIREIKYALNHFKSSSIVDVKEHKTLNYQEVSTAIAQLKQTFRNVNFEQKIVVFDFYENSLDLVVLFLFVLEQKGIPLILEVSKNQPNLLKEIPYFAIIGQRQSLLSVSDSHLRTYKTPFGELRINESQLDTSMVENCSLLLTSSGSTGSKKIIKCRESGVLQNIKSNITALGINEKDRTLICLPIYYSYSLIGQFLSHLIAGADIILAPNRFIPLYLNEVLKKHQPTNFFITPTLVRVLSAYQSHINCDPLKFVAIGGGYLSKNCFVKFTRQFTCAYYYKTYGITEAGPRVSTYTIAYDQIHNFQPNYIGAPLENVQLATGKAIGNYQGKVSCYLHINTPSVYTGYLIDHQHCHKKTLGLETRDIVYKQQQDYYILGRETDFFRAAGSLWRFQIEDILFDEIPGLLKVNIYSDQTEKLQLGLIRNKRNNNDSGVHFRDRLKERFSPSVMQSLIINDHHEKFTFSK